MKRMMAAYAALATMSWMLGGIWMPTAFAHAPSGPVVLLVQSYQQWLDPVDGRHCPSYPVCSRYAQEAIASHGMLVGSWLALDRLIHEGDDLERGPWVRVHGQKRLYDPVERNAFWLGGYSS